MQKKQLSSNLEDGLTLIEVLASIVILTIIIISILMILLQTMKTNKVSEGIIDATYTAQTEMEKIYALSEDEKPFPPQTSEYEEIDKSNKWTVYEKEVAENTNYIIRVSLNSSKDNVGMTRVLIQVYENGDTDNSIAQMENLFDWNWGAVQ